MNVQDILREYNTHVRAGIGHRHMDPEQLEWMEEQQAMIGDRIGEVQYRQAARMAKMGMPGKHNTYHSTDTVKARGAGADRQRWEGAQEEKRLGKRRALEPLIEGFPSDSANYAEATAAKVPRVGRVRGMRKQQPDPFPANLHLKAEKFADRQRKWGQYDKAKADYDANLASPREPEVRKIYGSHDPTRGLHKHREAFSNATAAKFFDDTVKESSYRSVRGSARGRDKRRSLACSHLLSHALC